VTDKKRCMHCSTLNHKSTTICIGCKQGLVSGYVIVKGVSDSVEKQSSKLGIKCPNCSSIHKTKVEECQCGYVFYGYTEQNSQDDNENNVIHKKMNNMLFADLWVYILFLFYSFLIVMGLFGDILYSDFFLSESPASEQELFTLLLIGKKRGILLIYGIIGMIAAIGLYKTKKYGYYLNLTILILGLIRYLGFIAFLPSTLSERFTYLGISLLTIVIIIYFNKRKEFYT